MGLLHRTAVVLLSIPLSFCSLCAFWCCERCRMSMNCAGSELTLAQARIGVAQRVKSLSAPEHAPQWAAWLEEMGFVPGEHVSVLCRALPGADPIVVRVGQSTFALRQAEAACVHVE
jgi:ferrous iron transport protein A